MTRIPIYDVAISFAGEDRPIAESLARLLTLRGLKVFYDAYEQADLWGKDLYSHLTTVYRDDAKFCVMLVSEHYNRKAWTTLERRSAQARAFRENAEYILPLRLDASEIVGLVETVGYLEYHKISEADIVDAVVMKVRSYNKAAGIVSELVGVAEAFARAGITPPIKDSFAVTTCPACGEEQRLSDAPMSLDGEETIYTCRNGCQTIVVVGRPGEGWPGRGFRLKDYVIRNVRDLDITTPEAKGVMRMPASSGSLMRKRPSPRTTNGG